MAFLAASLLALVLGACGADESVPTDGAGAAATADASGAIEKEAEASVDAAGASANAADANADAADAERRAIAAAVDRVDAPAGTVDAAAGESLIGERSALVEAARLDAYPAARFAGAGLVPPAEQREGDPIEGRRALVEEGYVACGLPLRVYRQLSADTPVTTLPGREAAADGLPYFMNASTDERGVDIASSNCLTCHGTPLFGELVLGLGNEFLDFTTDPSVAVERAGALVRGADESAAWERYADRIAAIAPYMSMRTVGTNPANNLTFALIAHRDAETNAWLEEPALPLPPAEPPPVSVPPWWRMAKKHAMFNLGEGRDDHARLMMSASMLCTDTIEELEAIDAYAPDIRAFIASLEPPAWPFALDAALADTGREVFEANCSACHGHYAFDADGARDRARDRYPNRLVPLALIDTDPTLVEHAHGEGVAYIDWFNRSYYGGESSAAPGPGYVAPPLDGVWASAPFLHNGSVPSVRTLLDSTSRPSLWHHVPSAASDPDDYDPRDIGWRHVAGDDIITTGEGAVAPERVYDTTRPGHANGGHRFGDHLSESDRDAVLEYLKTL